MIEESDILACDEDTGQRIDKFLSLRNLDISRTQIKKSIDQGFVRVNGKTVAPKYILKAGDIVSYRLLCTEQTTLLPVKIPLDILFEDDDIIVVNKRAGIVVHKGNGTVDPTLVECVLAHCSLSNIGGGLRPGVVHRLDKETSGAIIFAKTNLAYLQLIKMFSAREVHKTYQTIVCGTFTINCGEINFPIERSHSNRTKMVVSATGREAITRWSIIEQFGQKFSHISVNILTGRTHQIRVHMSHSRHPIIGDTTYGYNQNYSKTILPQRVMLHAAKLEFAHPITGEKMIVNSSLPEDFQTILDVLRNNKFC